MAFTISGTINFIGETIELPTQNGNSFKRRIIRLDASRYDNMTGEKRENYPTFDFTGEKCAMLDNFKPGDLVSISFALRGVKYSDKTTNETKYFNSINGYDIQVYVRKNGSQTIDATSTPISGGENIVTPVVSPRPQDEEDDLPF